MPPGGACSWGDGSAIQMVRDDELMFSHQLHELGSQGSVNWSGYVCTRVFGTDPPVIEHESPAIIDRAVDLESQQALYLAYGRCDPQSERQQFGLFASLGLQYGHCPKCCLSPFCALVRCHVTS